jgi:multidrug efflux system membrane fusion protein
LALTAALAVVHESAAACKPLTLVSSITPSITSAGMGTSPAAATLAREVLHTMLFHSLKFQGAVLAVFVGLVLVGGGLVYELRANAPGSVARAPVNQTAAAQAAGQGKTNTEQEPPLNPRFRTVRVAHPVEREAAPSADFTGRLTAKQTVEVRPTVSGRLEKINFKPGSEVKKGDLLFEIDNSTYRLDVQKAEAELMVTLAKRNQSETELIRGRKLQGAAIGKGDIDKLANQAAADEAGVNAAKVDVERAKLRMDSTRITAPISGRIGRPLVDIGNQVFGGGDRQSVLATITTLDPIGLSFDMDERSFLQYQRAERDHEVTGPGSLLGVGVPSAGGKEGFPMQATLDSFEDQVDPKTGTIRVHAALSNPDKLLLPGMYTRVRMFFGAPRVLLEVPRSALREGEGFSVLVLTDQNRVKERSVKVGVFEGHQLVEEGLRPEDWVVVDDYQHLRPGDRVEPERVTPPTRSTPSKE